MRTVPCGGGGERMWLNIRSYNFADVGVAVAGIRFRFQIIDEFELKLFWGGGRGVGYIIF